MASDNLYIRTGIFQFGCDLFSFCLGNAFFHILGSAVNQFFGFFQTKTRKILNDLHYVQFGSAATLQYYIECSLFFSCCCATAFATTSYYYSCGCGFDTIFCLQEICEFLYFLYSQANQAFC